MDDWLTVAEVAALLKVKVQTVRRWARRGVLPRPVKIARLARWRKRDIEARLGEVRKPFTREHADR